MAHPTWPLFDLVVRTPMLELRLPKEDELVELVTKSDVSIYDRTGFMPFHINWPGDPVSSMQFHWRTRAEWSADNWSLALVPFVGGRPVGNQGLLATDFGIVRTVRTGSYLLAEAQGRGIGTEMRAAALHLAFAGLDALEAHSEAHVDNLASNGVSRKLGYEMVGRQNAKFGDHRGEVYNLILRREIWEQNRRDDIEIIGLESCRHMFGSG